MYIKRFILLAVFALILINTVSAADNATYENLTDINPGEINVTYEEQMWEENLSDIEVSLPENATGEFMVKIDDEVIYNDTITEKSFKIPIKLPKAPDLYIAIYPPVDSRPYKVSAFYNNIDLNLTAPLKVMRFPPDYSPLHFPREILQNDKYHSLLAFPRSANGTVEFYIDDKLYNKTRARSSIYWPENPFSKLPLGDHTFRVVYHGDSYYHAYEKTFNFTVVKVIISIPEVINIGHDDCISVEAPKNTKGTVKVYIDDKLIDTSCTEDGQYILSLENHIKYTDREVKVTYTSKDFTRTVVKPVNMTYDFDVWASNFRYGANNIIDIMLPDTLNNKLLKITINGKEYSFTRPENVMNNNLELDISSFPAGNYSLFISYEGDDKFYPLNKTVEFTIDYTIILPFIFKYKSEAKVTLKLPNDAKGELVVYSDGALFGSAKFNKGYAEVKLGSLAIGPHKIEAEYNGTDYTVASQSGRVSVSPKIDFNYPVTVGEDEYITVEVPKSSTGYIIFTINGKEYKVQIRDGIAKYSIKKLKVGEYDVDVYYYGDDGVKSSSWVMVEVVKPKIKTISSESNFKGVNVKMKLSTHNGKALASKWVRIKFNGKTYNVKTSKKGILTFKKSLKLKIKKYTIKITYNGASLTKKIKVKPLILKASAKKKKLTVKVTINKKLKNKKVIVKINSKKYKIKTNRKGVAKITVKKTGKVTCSATYLKNTVKQSVKL